jgi:hypothetical protein
MLPIATFKPLVVDRLSPALFPIGGAIGEPHEAPNLPPARELSTPRFRLEVAGPRSQFRVELVGAKAPAFIHYA